MWRIMDKKGRVLCSLLLGLTVVLYQSANGLGMCSDGDSKFHMENKIQHCSDNDWEDECTITWSTINADTACSRLTELPTTPTVTKTITMTMFRDHSTKTVTTTATQTVSATSGCSTSSFIMSSQHLPTVNSMSRTTTPSSSLDLPRPSPTSQLRPTSHQLSAAVAATSAAVPSGSTAGTSQPGAVLQPSPSNIDHDMLDQKRTLMCNTASTVLAIVSGTLLLCLALSLIGWMWTCCALRRMRESHTSTKQKPLKRGHTASNGEHKFENPLYETNSLDSNAHTYSPESQAGYETVMFDDKNPAGAREQRFIVKTAVDGGPYYHVLEKPLPDHAIIDTNEQDREENGTDSASS